MLLWLSFPYTRDACMTLSIADLQSSLAPKLHRMASTQAPGWQLRSSDSIGGSALTCILVVALWKAFTTRAVSDLAAHCGAVGAHVLHGSTSAHLTVLRDYACIMTMRCKP